VDQEQRPGGDSGGRLSASGLGAQANHCDGQRLFGRYRDHNRGSEAVAEESEMVNTSPVDRSHCRTDVGDPIPHDAGRAVVAEVYAKGTDAMRSQIQRQDLMNAVGGAVKAAIEATHHDDDGAIGGGSVVQGVHRSAGACRLNELRLIHTLIITHATQRLHIPYELISSRVVRTHWSSAW